MIMMMMMIMITMMTSNYYLNVAGNDRIFRPIEREILKIK